MKRKICAAALAAGLLLFAGCSVQTVTPFSADWQQNPSVYDRNFYEKTEYSVSFERGESFAGGVVFQPGEGSAFTVTVEAVPAQDGHYQLYRLTSTLTLAGSYIYLGEDGQESEVVAFGGESGNAPGRIERTALFSSPHEGNLEPLESSSTIYSYTPVAQNSRAVEVYSYGYTVKYTDGGSRATATYTDGFAGLTEAESAINAATRKVSVFAEGMLPEGEIAIDGIQSRYTGIDEAYLLFAGRGITYASDASTPLTVVGGGSARAVSLRGTAGSYSAAGEKSFTLDGEAVEDEAIESVVVSARLADGGTNSGPMQTAVYALPDQADADGNAQGNLYYALPLEVRQAFGFSGTSAQIVYTLKTVTHTNVEA